MNVAPPPLTEPEIKTVADLANDLTLAKDDVVSQGRGRAIFLVGAGCSVSADIPPASGVAKHCAVKLAKIYSSGTFQDDNSETALDWLHQEGKVDLVGDYAVKEDGSHWGALYSHFFESHLKSPNQQREIINEIIDAASDRLNWAHACLGELVALRYVHTVLTTNFDQLVLQGIIRTGVLPVTADGLEALNRITGKPRRPQVVHLHGSMHTYNLRNSRTALNETSQDSGALSMIHGLLQQCDLLVVVGYSGGEEGIMKLLSEATRTMPQLVIYWVTYETGHDSLSPNTRSLLAGENKFTIWGGTADKFFGDLMAELRIGQPRWVADPIAVLREQSERLQSPQDELDGVRILVEAFKDRVAFADRPESRWPEANQVKVKAADKRSRREFGAAREILEQIDLSADLEAARLHALNAHSMFEEEWQNGVASETGIAMLQSAIDEFTRLVEKTTGPAQLDNILSLANALFDLNEATPEDDDAQAGSESLRKVVEVVERALPSYPPDTASLANARLNLLLAQALQALGERSENAEELARSEAAYVLAITGFAANRDPDGRVNEAKSGLAALLQIQGENGSDASKLRRAVMLHREMIDGARGGERSKEEAGPLENLAGSLRSLASIVDEAEARPLLLEAKSSLDRVVLAYRREGDASREQDVVRSLGEIDEALMALH
jgi:NAD-dependent SIR2 family protein deacetylase